MERAFIVSKEVGFGKELKDYYKKAQHRYDKVISFLRIHNIEAKCIYLCGDGFCNCAFDENYKNEISLGIVPTKEDTHLLKGILGKECEEGLRFLRRNSKIMREFQQYCVDEKIIINLNKPDLWDYFESFQFKRHHRAIFGLDGVYYLKVSSEFLKEDDIPEGMTPIKLSEYYAKLEEFQEKEKQN